MSVDPDFKVPVSQQTFQKLQVLCSMMNLDMPDLIENLVRDKVTVTTDAPAEYQQSKGGESSEHQKLKQIASQYLQVEFGFGPKDIHFEYRIPDGWVDVAGANQKRKVAVEVGHASITRLLGLYEHFDTVVWIPYWLTLVTGEEDLEGEVRRRVRETLERERRALMKTQYRELQGRALSQIQGAKEIIAVVLAECTDRNLKVKLAKIAERTFGHDQLGPAHFARKEGEDMGSRRGRDVDSSADSSA